MISTVYYTDVCTYLKKKKHVFFSTDGPPDIRINIKFVQDTSKYWYKPEITREQGEIFNIHFHKMFFSVKWIKLFFCSLKL